MMRYGVTSGHAGPFDSVVGMETTADPTPVASTIYRAIRLPRSYLGICTRPWASLTMRNGDGAHTIPSIFHALSWPLMYFRVSGLPLPPDRRSGCEVQDGRARVGYDRKEGTVSGPKFFSQAERYVKLQPRRTELRKGRGKLVL